MISTVTTTTTTTVTTVTTVAGIVATLGVAGAIALIGFLCTKELVAVGNNRKMKVLARGLNVAVVPLVMVFAVMVAVQVLGVISN